MQDYAFVSGMMLSLAAGTAMNNYNLTGHSIVEGFSSGGNIISSQILAYLIDNKVKLPLAGVPVLVTTACNIIRMC